VLVAESYDSRLRLLKDRDRDGVAESDRVFATEANGINQQLCVSVVSQSNIFSF
jgi:hypothetical protein